MITDGKKWHYFGVKKLSALFWGVLSNHKEDFYCLNYFHSCSTNEVHDYYYAEMPKKDIKILKWNHGEKSMKVQFIIYADFESLLENINTYPNNPKKSSTTKINKHTPSGLSLFMHCSFDATKIKFDYYIEVKIV